MRNRSLVPAPCRGAPLTSLFGLAVVLLVSSASVALAAGQEPLDRVARNFWNATSAAERDEAARAVVTAARSTDLAPLVAALRAGRNYPNAVDTGRQLLTRRSRDGREFPYVVHVPETYDPTRSYAVRVYLHGGVMRPKRDDGSWIRDPDRYLSEDAIVVFPTSWPEAIWWQTSQVENLSGILNDLKSRYHIDENRVFLMGVSDGATGAYYHAFKATTPWAGFLTFIGHPGVLANPSSDVDGEMHVANLTNKPFFVVNGGVDRLYPVSSVEPFIDLFVRAGVDLDFRPQPTSGHDMRWWPELASSVDTFLAETVRDPLPDRLTWETEDVEWSNRAHWLVIDDLGSVKGDGQFESLNMLMRRVPTTPLGLGMLGEIEGRSGLILMDVGEASIVEMAGIQPNDILVSVGGAAISSVDSLREALTGFAPGDELPVVVEREGTQIELRLSYPTGTVAQGRPAFQHVRSSGRLDVVREGNTVSVTSEGVRRYTLLLSPDQFDFDRPVRVVTNGVVSHDAVVPPDPSTTMRWAAIDQDRTLLFGAELTIDVSDVD